MKRFALLTALILWLPFARAEKVSFTINSGLNDPVLKEKIETAVSQLLSEFNRAHEKKVTPVLSGIPITDDARDAVLMLWDNTPFYCDECDIVEPVIKVYDGDYQVRNIPLEYFNEKGEQTYQELVVNLDPSGIITRVNLAIEAHLYRRIMSDGSLVADEEQRQIILNYVEDFRTAYNKKDIGFLEMVFSDDALIITGKVIQRKKGDSVTMNPDVVYTKYSKKEYLDRLRYHIFPNTKTIEVHFEEARLVKHPTIEGYYGVTVRQSYKSVFKDGGVYEDEGYLFMLWDFRDKSRPQIHVRTWQPYWMDEAKTNTLPEDKIININSFRITK